MALKGPMGMAYLCFLFDARSSGVSFFSSSRLALLLGYDGMIGFFSFVWLVVDWNSMHFCCCMYQT